MGLVLGAACCGEIAFVFVVTFGVVPAVLGVLGGSVAYGFGGMMAPLVIKIVDLFVWV